MADPWADAQAKGVAVLDPDSWADDGDAYTIQGVSRPLPSGAPVVTGTSPATLAVDDPAQEILVGGSDFTRDCRVSFGGATPPTSFHSDTELAVRINPADWSAGTVLVLVAYSDRGPSDAVDFTWTGAAAREQASSGVPQGTISEVLDWVGDDPQRARQALDAERQGQQRSTLISQLEQLAG